MLLILSKWLVAIAFIGVLVLLGRMLWQWQWLKQLREARDDRKMFDYYDEQLIEGALSEVELEHYRSLRDKHGFQRRKAR